MEFSKNDEDETFGIEEEEGRNPLEKPNFS